MRKLVDVRAFGPLAPERLYSKLNRLIEFFCFLEEVVQPMKTYMAKGETLQRDWYIVDAEGQTLGRMASQVASILRGKNKPIFTPHVDCGDHVIIINADKVVMTGKKLDQKKYYHHSGYVGGLKETSYRELMEKKPEFVVYEAVRRMLPKGPLGRKTLTKLRVYSGTEHNHEAQQPQPLVLPY